MMTSLVFLRSSSRFEMYRISGPTDAMNFNVFVLWRLTWPFTLPLMLLRSPLGDLRVLLIGSDCCVAVSRDAPPETLCARPLLLDCACCGSVTTAVLATNFICRPNRAIRSEEYVV